MLPFYVFVGFIILFGAVRRVTGFMVPAEEGLVNADCEQICNRFTQCMASAVPPAQFQQYSFIIGAGCRNGCAKQGHAMGDCFQGNYECTQIAQCIGSKLR